MQKSLAIYLLLGLVCTSCVESRRLQGAVTGLTDGLGEDVGTLVKTTGTGQDQLLTGTADTLNGNLQIVGDAAAENTGYKNTAAAVEGVLAGRRLQGAVTDLTGAVGEDVGTLVKTTGTGQDQLLTGTADTLNGNLQIVGDAAAENTGYKNTAGAVDNVLSG